MEEICNLELCEKYFGPDALDAAIAFMDADKELTEAASEVIATGLSLEDKLDAIERVSIAVYNARTKREKCRGILLRLLGREN
jgi:hypothetical protein